MVTSIYINYTDVHQRIEKNIGNISHIENNTISKYSSPDPPVWYVTTVKNEETMSNLSSKVRELSQ